MATAAEEQTGKKIAVTSGNKLAAFIPTSLEEAWRLAGALAGSGMTPKSYGTDQNKIMVGMMAGAEVGLPPFTALQSIAVIGNNPSLWGDGALGLIQASGLLEDMEEADDGNTATCRMVRKGRPTPIIKTFSMDDAKKAGLAGKAGPWTQYPARMRQMRARAFAMRDGFSDVLKGLAIAEEARDYSPIDAGVLSSAPLTGQALLEQASDQPATGALPAEAEPLNPAEEVAASAEEGKPDEERGEAVTLARVLDEIKAAPEVRDVNHLVSAHLQTFAGSEADEIRNAGAERCDAILRAA